MSRGSLSRPQLREQFLILPFLPRPREKCLKLFLLPRCGPWFRLDDVWGFLAKPSLRKPW
jgi:hypothetical protein